MPGELTTRYSDAQLQRILKEAMIYMCACPAQVAEQIIRLRSLYAYQKDCISKGDLTASTHHRISDAARNAHAELEQCLSDVLQMEGWDPQTLSMPAGLRELRLKQIKQD